MPEAILVVANKLAVHVNCRTPVHSFEVKKETLKALHGFRDLRVHHSILQMNGSLPWQCRCNQHAYDWALPII